MQRSQEPSVWQKMKMGFIMGAGVGMTTGFIFGSYTILRGGAGPRGALSTLSQYMLASGGMFSFFLAVGSVIRNDTALDFPVQGRVPVNVTPLAVMQARWAQDRRSRS
ncbi:reactive mitochondrial oxygen species modulator 1-domain-containing protein [Schizophyllum amplum]|uniref:Reactive mitochondrial oxygen species modulator 1-domain-containing protein n=1 Tax=Schizophyllum amplum TaxID=97359 RepID=A0A550CLL0_9AGAR|nr:reactive mitochondrial oxygen species modulator 1-domain-containing protein [Auriculariopsis ampla]